MVAGLRPLPQQPPAWSPRQRCLRRREQPVDKRQPRLREMIVGRLRPGADDRDHRLAGGIDGDALAEDADSAEAVSRIGPPLIAIAEPGPAPGIGMGARRLREPARRDDARAALHRQLPHPRIIAQRDGEAAAAHLAPGGVGHPEGVALHAVALPHPLAEIGGERHLHRVADQHADQVGLAGLVHPFAARHGLARQGAHIGDGGVHPRRHGDREHPRHVGFRIGIILVPLHARRHRQQLRDRHAVIGAAGEVRDVFRHRLLDRLDEAVADRRPDKRRGE